MRKRPECSGSRLLLTPKLTPGGALGNEIGSLEIENLLARHEAVTAALAFGMWKNQLKNTL